MICSSLARNRSPDPVVSCCFGRIVPSDATTESQFDSKWNPENEIARFRALKPQYLAISILPARQKQILRQWASRCSRTTSLRVADMLVLGAQALAVLRFDRNH